MSLKGGICIVAGEASGDVQAAHVVSALRREFAALGVDDLSFWGAAGPVLRAAGVEALISSEELAVMGFSEVLSQLPRLLGVENLLLQALEERRPAALICVDYPGFNLRLIERAMNLGLTVIYHIPPKVWAHGAKRMAQLRDYTHLVTSILPFEVSSLCSAGVNAVFVGNPLRDAAEEARQLRMARAAAPGVSAGEKTRIGLLPGSRVSEIEKMLPLFVGAFVALERSLGRPLQAQLPLAPTLERDFVWEVAASGARAAGVTEEWLRERLSLDGGDTLSVLSAVDYAWICSGTAALEGTFVGVPMAVAYRMQPLSALIAKMILRVPYVSLPNLCAQKAIVPEFLQGQATVENLVTHAHRMLDESDSRQKMLQDLAEVTEMFPLGAAGRAARVMTDTILRLLIPTEAKFRLQRARKEELLRRLSGPT